MYGNVHIAFALGIEPTVEIYGAGIVTVNPECPTVIGKKLVFLTQNYHIFPSSKSCITLFDCNYDFKKIL